MIDVPVHWLSYQERNPKRGRWDQLFVERLLSGEEGRPPYGYRFVDDDVLPIEGGVVVFSAGFYAENDLVDRGIQLLTDDLNDMAWCVLIATSDETQSFPWDRIDPWPTHVKLWVMLPKPGNIYPPGSRFIGEGSPVSGKTICENAAFTRDLDLMLVGQGGHVRRDQAFHAAHAVRPGLDTKVMKTSGFTQGMTQEEYLFHLTRAWIAPAPSGICSQSSFRAYEALEAGCIPILDEQNPAGESGFWEMLGLDKVAPTIQFWRDLPAMTDSILNNRVETAAMCSSRWQQHKRRMLQWLYDDVSHVGNISEDGTFDGRFIERDGPHDEITVIIPTSPVPSNPDISMIQQTVASIRSELPGAEILITCDGIRDEQLDRADDYHFFLHRLCMWTNTQFNAWPFIHSEHLHQSGMMHSILPEVRTPYVLYVEHDCPLEGAIPFADILRTMEMNDLNSMRFLHEVAIPPGSEHLFLGRVAHMSKVGEGGPEPVAWFAPFAKTIQWSQRPHVARTDWYREIMSTHFAPDARTMIEDVMHGVVQAGTYAGRKRAREAWERFRMGVYAPEGSWKRSGHLDGRADDPKFPMLMKYPDGNRPEGAPPEGWQ